MQGRTRDRPTRGGQTPPRRRSGCPSTRTDSPAPAVHSRGLRSSIAAVLANFGPDESAAALLARPRGTRSGFHPGTKRKTGRHRNQVGQPSEPVRRCRHSGAQRRAQEKPQLGLRRCVACGQGQIVGQRFFCPALGLDGQGLKTGSRSIIQFGYFNSRFVTPAKYKWSVTVVLCYSSDTFDEKLHEPISHDLADADGRESDTS